jgi:hypothetical protein
MRTKRKVTFIFIAGAEGSGTTLMSRLLSAPKCCASLGGLHVKVPPLEDTQALADAFQAANRFVCDRKATFADNRQAKRQWRSAWEGILESDSFAHTTHFVFKRSFPFGNPREQFVPHLWDVEDVIGDVEFAVMFRDPRASTFSTLRRGFDQDLRRLAVLCSEQLTLLSAQAQTIPKARLKVISYSKLCLQPAATLAPLIVGFGLDRDAMHKATAQELPAPLIDDRYRRTLSSDQISYLDEFFDARRCTQWEFLKNAAGE